ncbi:hypothetical protein Bca101_055004 [Brassica carinata]
MREKKVYDLPGQKRDQPDESGLLPAAEAKNVLEKRLQKTGKFSSPAKPTASTPRTSSKSLTEKKEVRKPSSEAVSGKNKRSDAKLTTKKRKKDSDDDDSGNRVPKKTRAK